MILVDTSIWIDHFRRTQPRLVEALTHHEVMIHSVIIGELATGNLADRSRILADLQNLDRVTEASLRDCLQFLESRTLYGRGLGWNDVQLLASAILGKVSLWSLDKRLCDASLALGIAFQP